MVDKNNIFREYDIRGIFGEDGGYALVRASNTQPVIVVRCEASSPEILKEIEDFTLKMVETAKKRIL